MEAQHAVHDADTGVYESASGCGAGTSLVDCNGYIEGQIDDCSGITTTPQGTYHKNYGTFFDGDICKAVCCTFDGAM